MVCFFLNALDARLNDSSLLASHAKKKKKRIIDNWMLNSKTCDTLAFFPKKHVSVSGDQYVPLFHVSGLLIVQFGR